MNYFKNEDHIIFRALTDEQKLVIIANKGRGYVESPMSKCSDTWLKANTHNIDLDGVYRVLPKAMTEIQVMDKIINCTHPALGDNDIAAIGKVITDLFNRGIVK